MRDYPLPAGDVATLQDRGDLFSGVATIVSYDIPTVHETGLTEVVRNATVTTNLFSVLGVQMTAGRDFTEADGAPKPNVGSEEAPQPSPPSMAPGAAGGGARSGKRFA